MTEYRYVERLPDLIDPAQYADDPNGRAVRIRIMTSDRGVEILGDAIRPEVLEALLACVDPGEIEQMLCG